MVLAHTAWAKERTMTTDLTHRLAIYPMVEEAESVGVVAAVYSRILSRMPLVPSLFKSFAVCPRVPRAGVAAG